MTAYRNLVVTSSLSSDWDTWKWKWGFYLYVGDIWLIWSGAVELRGSNSSTSCFWRDPDALKVTSAHGRSADLNQIKPALIRSAGKKQESKLKCQVIGLCSSSSSGDSAASPGRAPSVCPAPSSSSPFIRGLINHHHHHSSVDWHLSVCRPPVSKPVL